MKYWTARKPAGECIPAERFACRLRLRLTHQINANWVANLPLAKGQRLAGNAGRGLNAVVGGWQLSGVARWASGFPG
jgi:hypothetical protein